MQDNTALSRDLDPASYSGVLLVSRVFSVAFYVVASILVARMLGPVLLGKFGLLQSVSSWFVLLASFGTNQVVLRHMPEILLGKGEKESREIFASLLGLRIAGSVVLALAFICIYFRSRDAYEMGTVVWIGLSIVPIAISNLVFAGLLSNCQMTTWSIRPIIGSISRLLFLPCGILIGGLSGAGAGAFFAVVPALVFGLWCMRERLSIPTCRWRLLLPYRKFASSLFVAGLLQAALFASGVVIVKFMSNDFREVGFFGVGMAVFGRCSFILPRLAVTYTPMIVRLRTVGQGAKVETLFSRAVGLSTLTSVFIAYVLLLPVRYGLPFLLGSDYLPAMENLIPLSGAVVIFVFFSLCRALAVAMNQARLVVVAELFQLIIFWLAGIWLTEMMGSFGTSLALLFSFVIGASCLWIGTGFSKGVPIDKWIKISTLGALFLPMVVLANGFWSSLGILVFISSLFFFLVFSFKLVTMEEIRLACSRLSVPFAGLFRGRSG